MEKFKLVSFGNSKLPKSTMIFNMGAAFDCPSEKLGLCKLAAICYAKKSEKMYKQVLPYRQRQAQTWLNSDKETMFNLLLSAVKKTTNKIRINESGDFYSQNCVDKLEYIAKRFYNELNITVYVYTARKDLNFNNCKYLVINASGFYKTGISNEFTAVSEYTKGNLKCRGNCKICSICSIKTGRKIEVLKH